LRGRRRVLGVCFAFHQFDPLAVLHLLSSALLEAIGGGGTQTTAVIGHLVGGPFLDDALQIAKVFVDLTLFTTTMSDGAAQVICFVGLDHRCQSNKTKLRERISEQQHSERQRTNVETISIHVERVDSIGFGVLQNLADGVTATMLLMKSHLKMKKREHREKREKRRVTTMMWISKFKSNLPNGFVDGHVANAIQEFSHFLDTSLDRTLASNRLTRTGFFDFRQCGSLSSCGDI
jgi:hypothetical protein